MTGKLQVLTIKDVLGKMVLAPVLDDNTNARIERGLEKIKDIDTQFFGFEDIDSQIDEVTGRIAKDTTRAEMAKLGYPELDFSFLAMRKKDSKLPAFMVFNLDSNEFSITTECSEDRATDISDVIWSIEPDLPLPLSALYEEAIVYLAQLSISDYDNEEIVITAQFKGIMPMDARKKTIKARDLEIFDQIFIIAEAPLWVVNKTGHTSRKDPLVVGWNQETQQMFLITAFDPTSLEDYVLTQFKK